MVCTAYYLTCTPVKHCRSVETLLEALDRGEHARLKVIASPERKPYVRRTQKTVTIRLVHEDVTISTRTYERIADKLDISLKA